MSEIVERARHDWANVRPIPPDLVISLIAEIERLQQEILAMRQDHGAVVAGLQGEIERLRAALAIQYGMHPGGDLAKATQAEIERLRAASEASMMAERTFVCSICQQEFKGWANNAWPVNAGRCCNTCNWTIVLPARIARSESVPTESHGDTEGEIPQ
jgi:hypothetical protein